jgi:hypothetical protein
MKIGGKPKSNPIYVKWEDTDDIVVNASRFNSS